MRWMTFEWQKEQRPKRRRIAFFGLFGTGNVGNEASLSSALLAAREIDPTAELVCVCARPDVVRAEHGISAVPIYMAGPLPDAPSGPRVVRAVARPLYELARWSAIYRFLRTIDLVIVPGTGILDDFGESPKGMPYHLFRWTVAARLARRRFAFVSVGGGPITHPVSRWFMRNAVKFSSYCSYRDEFSRSYMAGIGASPVDAPVTPDLVFALPRPIPSREPTEEKTVGLGVMTYYGWTNDPATGADVFQTYVDKMATIACRLLDSGHVVRVLIGERCDEQAVDALLESIRSRQDGRTKSDRLIVEPIESMRDLLVQIGETDAVIGTRYHNVVGALMLERPVVSLGYAAKFVDLMEGMGLGNFCHDASAIEPDAVLADLEKLFVEWDVLVDGPKSRNRQYADELERQYVAVIGSSPASDPWFRSGI
jgi:polysaccharide pyruvyl transferase WcaK-like protein